MSSNTPIERLNYFNGQRLEAADFRLEQDFHIRVRRELNKRLFTAGIAGGLTVEKVMPEPSHKVAVLPGLALDSEGREIILVERKEVPVAGKPTKPGEPVRGNYLVIEYAEEKIATVSDGCAVRIGVTCKATEDLKWGDLSRIRAEPRLSIQDPWPKPGDNKIVLAQLDLNEDCSIREIRTFVRRKVETAKPVTTRTIAIEGEKDIDPKNSKELYFQIANSAPTQAVLQIRGLQFSTLYYTELARHTHVIHANADAQTKDLRHGHQFTNDLETEDGGVHTHDYLVDDGETAGGIDVNDTQTNRRNTDRSAIIDSPPHHHVIKKEKIALDKGVFDDGVSVWTHSHPITATADETGQTNGEVARVGDVHTHVDNLRIAVDGNDITPLILTQLQDRDGAGAWQKLGDGSAIHKISATDANGKVDGTGDIDLLRVGADLSPGEHRLTFSVAAGGGRIQYNLYIE